MKLTVRRVRSDLGEETEIVLPEDKNNRRRTSALGKDGDKDNGPRGALIGPPDAKFVVHDLRQLPPPSRKGAYLVVVTRVADGKQGAFELQASPGLGCFEVAEEDEEAFDEFFE